VESPLPGSLVVYEATYLEKAEIMLVLETYMNENGDLLARVLKSNGTISTYYVNSLDVI
jgi:hypothetical protein